MAVYPPRGTTPWDEPLRQYVLGKIDEVLAILPDRVTDALAASGTVAQAAATAAAAAVGSALNNAGVLYGVSSFDSTLTGAEDLHTSFTDSAGRRSWVEWLSDGRPSKHSVNLIGDGLGYKQVALEYLGLSFATVDSAGRRGDLELGIDGALTQRVIDRHAVRYAQNNALPKDQVWRPDSIMEWWTSRPFYTKEPYYRLIGTAISTSGQQLLSEDVPGVGSRDVVVSTTPPDDHSVPAPILSGTRLGAIIQEHGLTSNLRFAIGGPEGSIDSVATAPIQTIDVTNSVGGNVSYAQDFIVRHLSTASLTTHWVFYRCGATGDQWAITEYTVDHATGLVSEVWSRVLLRYPGNQVYMSLADAYAAGNQRLRFIFGCNPNSANHQVYYGEVDVVTGAVTSPVTSLVDKNIRTPAGMPILATSMTPAIAQAASSASRRLTCVRSGPYKPGILITDWTEGDEDNGTYKVVNIESDGSTTSVSYGIAGKRVGYIAGSNYLPQGDFPSPAYDDTVALGYNPPAGLARVDVWRTPRGSSAPVAKTVAISSNPLIRPLYPVGVGPYGVLYSDVSSYSPTSYNQYVAHVKSSREGR